MLGSLRRSSAALAVLVCPLLIGPVPRSTLVRPTGGTTSSAPCANRPGYRTGSTRTIERSVLCLLNRERQRRHRRPLQRNAMLDKAARWQSRDMVAHAYFGHRRRGGPNFVQRIRRTGYLKGVRRWLVGENIAFGAGASGTAAGIVKAWMASPDHKENILERAYEDVGIGLVIGSPEGGDRSTPDGERGVTITTDFGLRSSTL